MTWDDLIFNRAQVTIKQVEFHVEPVFASMLNYILKEKSRSLLHTCSWVLVAQHETATIMCSWAY